MITPLLLGYSVVTCLPAVHKRDDLRLFACFLISPRFIGWDFLYLSIISTAFYPLIPDVLIPSTSVFWNRKNRIIIGTSDSTDMASIGP